MSNTDFSVCAVDDIYRDYTGDNFGDVCPHHTARMAALLREWARLAHPPMSLCDEICDLLGEEQRTSSQTSDEVE